MSGRAWGIKLGSGGAWVPFCEQHEIVGIGWEGVDPQLVSRGTWDQLWEHVKESHGQWYDTPKKIGIATGTLRRFGQKCTEGDYVLYYDPPQKRVRICRVTSGPLRRDFDLNAAVVIEGEPTPIDIWHYRKVEYPVPAVSILDFYGGLKGSLLGPPATFWELSRFDYVEQIASGHSPHLVAAPDEALQGAYDELQSLLVKRAEALNEGDWEWLVVDYLKAQGAQIDERKVGGNQPIIDVEAQFDHGELPGQVWRVQVKRWQGQQVDWPDIEHAFRRVGEARLCFVSVFGFTDEARKKAEGIILLEAADFTRFLLSGKLRPRLLEKLQLPLRLQGTWLL